MATKKIIAIIAAGLVFLASAITNVWYFFDDDPATAPNVTEVIEKGKDVYEAIKADTAPESPAPEQPATAPASEAALLQGSVYSQDGDRTAATGIWRQEHRENVLLPITTAREASA